MRSRVHILYVVLLFHNTIKNVISGIDEYHEYLNRTDPATCQLYEFKMEHPKPIGILTTSSGKLVEIRETTGLNADALSNSHSIDLITHADAERIPERVVHAKGGGAFGYFEVTHDVSNYTKADVLNGIGKRTPVFVRTSSVGINLGGSDVTRDVKGFSVKLYTQEGNWDLLCLNFPVFFVKDPVAFPYFVHAFKRNPKTNLFDFTMRWDFIIKNPSALHGALFLFSDYGIPNGYRKMDAFAIHTFEINNRNGERYFVRFNWRTEQGVENLPSDVAQDLGARDPDYFNRDLYNSIENKNYPAWLLEMDVMTFDDIKQLDYNPFEVIRIWKKGTYITVPVGRLVLNKNPDNFFRTVELSAFNPGNLIPGVPGPVDNLFRSRRSSYRNTQVYRLTVNHNKIEVNAPVYSKVYNRDGKPPVRDNMHDAPNYYPNSFNGPVPYVDPSSPKERIMVYEVNAVDLEPSAYFYNHYLQTDAQRWRLVNNTVQALVQVTPFIQSRAIRLFKLTDPELGGRVETCLKIALQAPPPPPLQVIKNPRWYYDDKDVHGNHYYGFNK